jgi:uncharacterized protein YjbI with pentapeptide repeats
MKSTVSFVGLGSGMKMEGETNPINVGMSPETGVIGEDAHYNYVTDTTRVDLFNQRASDINHPPLPAIYNQLESDEAKEEFRTLWKLVQSIRSNPNAHQIGMGTDADKLLITTQPLSLNNFLTEAINYQFSLRDFFKTNNITLRRAFLQSADLAYANLSNADLNKAILLDADLSNADLSKAYLFYANLNNANLRDADLRHADLSGAKLCEAKLCEAKLSNANLSNAYLFYADLSNAYLNKANLLDADLRYAKLSNANLFYADLTNADLTNADLTNADLNGILINKNTNFNGKSLDNIKCSSIRFKSDDDTITKITELEKIKQKFIELGARGAKISFAELA